MNRAIRIFAGSAGRVFAERMCNYLEIKPAPTEVMKFPEGNTYVKIGEHVRGREVYIVQPIALNANDEFMELLFWLDAFRRSGATYITAVIPYFSYAKGDKKDEPRVSIRARVCAECLELAGADRIITMDLHAAQIQGFFRIPVDHLYARPLLSSYVEILKIENPVIIAPDAGAAKNARKFADLLDYPVAIANKNRSSHTGRPEILEIIGDVRDKNAIIVDDFSITGGTLANLSLTLQSQGVREIYACLSHLPLSADGFETLTNSNIKTVITTDSVTNPFITKSCKFKIISAAPLFAETVRRMHMREPISTLFEKPGTEIFSESVKYC